MQSTCQLIGRLTREPDIKTTPSGVQIGNIGIATNYKYKDVEEVSFFNITCFKNLLGVFPYLFKGQLVAITGRLKQDKWKDKNGNNQERISVIADSITILQFKEKEKQSQENNNSYPDFDAPPF